MIKRVILPFWIFAAVLLFLYSYTQVDLSLTLSKASIFQTIEKTFQYIGWFNRPLSTTLYLVVFILLFITYFITVKYTYKDRITRKQIWTVILIVSSILTFSYNAFSYDLFNYIFDAKIVTYYHLNPYSFKALDFPNDPMLSFMHWTHRTYPYGPFWLVLTIPVSFLGMQVFLLTFLLYKILISSFFLLTALSIERISRILKYKNTLLPLVAFALNPFVLSETLVSSHNDIVMMGLLMLGIYYLLIKRNLSGWTLVLLSIATKFATILPAIIIIFLKLVKREKYVIKACGFVMIIAVLLASARTTYQPWYLLYVMPFASLLIGRKSIRLPFYVLSIMSVLLYIPFLYLGNWNSPVPFVLNLIISIGIAISLFLFSIFSFWKK